MNPYQFKIIDDDNINMYALPGGFIYVSRGLIDAAQNEPELAGALAHAIAHVALRHGSAEVSQAYADEVPNATRSRVNVRDVMSRMNIHFDMDSIVLNYSREQERQADIVATQIMVDSRFDPRQMSQLLQVLADDRSAGLAGAESGETIERCAIPLDLLIETLSNEFAEADTNRIPMTSGRQSAANDSMYCRHGAFPRFTLLIAIR